MVPPLVIPKFTNKSAAASQPSASVTVPNGYKMLGGGAVIDSVEPSNFLTASYPVNRQTWFAAGKDHEVASPASIRVWAFAIEDLDDIWDVQMVSATSGPASHPKVAVGLTDDYVLTGGGAFVDYRGAGSMLTASFPGETAEGDWFKWEAHSKDHQISDPAQLTVYAIGIRLRSAPAGSPGVQNFIQIATGGGLDDPSGPLTDVHKPEITVPGPPPSRLAAYRRGRLRYVW